MPVVFFFGGLKVVVRRLADDFYLFADLFHCLIDYVLWYGFLGEMGTHFSGDTAGDVLTSAEGVSVGVGVAVFHF